MKTAVVLFNLGGPDSLSSVSPFLFNLFNDKAIISLPQPLRAIVARFIALKRAGIAKKIYAEMDGKSPILEETTRQAEALEKELGSMGEYQVFVAMRYWHPMISEVVEEVKTYDPARVILLPLYPQFSTTTTASAFAEWNTQAKKQGLTAAHHPICCYPFDAHFTDAHVQLIKSALEGASKHGAPRLLFSAHGLPQKLVHKGDPYQWQIERTVQTVMRKLGGAAMDHVICYQSKVGHLAWLTPSTGEEIERAGENQVPVVVVPIAFVSEHSETLVELDIEYKTLAENCGVPHYERVPALGIQPEFIKSLAWLVEATKLYPSCSNSLGRQCPKDLAKCGFKEWKV